MKPLKPILIRWLEAEVRHHRRKYELGEAEIPDALFDELEDFLRLVDPENPALSIVGTG